MKEKAMGNAPRKGEKNRIFWRMKKQILYAFSQEKRIFL